MTDLNLAGESHAHSLVSAGRVDKTSSWSFSAEDGNALLGSKGDDWAAYSAMHLGLDRGASDKTKARYKYPFGKGGKVYRSGVIAAKQRAAQQGESAIENAANSILTQIDKDKAAPQGKVKDFDAEVKDAGQRTLGFTISTSSVDRMGDTVSVDGWQLDSYRRNPVVLWAHNSSGLPVGAAQNIRAEGGKLKADVQFTPEGMVPFNDTVYELYKAGFLNATSVGFMPINFEYSADPARKMGIDFLQQELLEFSLVPVPANADALIQGKQAGIDVGPLEDWCASQIGDDRVARMAEVIAARRDLFADSFARRIAGAASIPILTTDRRKRVEELERNATRARSRAKMKRDLELIRLRG